MAPAAGKKSEEKKKRPLWLTAGLALINGSITLEIRLARLIWSDGRRERQLVKYVLTFYWYHAVIDAV